MMNAISDFSAGTTVAEAVTIPGAAALVGAVVGAGAEGAWLAQPVNMIANIRNIETDNFFMMVYLPVWIATSVVMPQRNP